MSRTRQNITLPVNLILDVRISANAKIVYAVLKTFPANKVQSDSPSVAVTHGALIERSGLSHHTVVKSLNRLETAGWIIQQRNLGSASRYYFTSAGSFEKKINALTGAFIKNIREFSDRAAAHRGSEK